jgi:hypothetical protein
MTPPSAAAAAAPARRARSAAPARAPGTTPRPRRVSGPARPARRVLPVPGVTAPGLNEGGLVLGLLERVAGRSRQRWLERLLGGRVWIGLVAFALIGIVTLQLGLLKLNAGVGHALEREATLQRENATLSIENSELAAGPRVEASAGRLGMELVPSGALQFLTVHPHSDAVHAASALNAHIQAPSTEATQPAGEGGSEATQGAGEEGSGEAAASAATSATGEASSPSSESPAAPGESSSTAASTPVQSAQGASEAQGTAQSTAAGSSEGTPTGGAQAGPAE